MRSHLFIPWLATVTSAVDTCGYLVTDPLAANLLHARESCSSFVQTTNSLCTTTVTSTRTVTTSAPTTATTIQTITLTTITTSNTTTTSVTTSSPVVYQANYVATTTLPVNPSGPIGGSSDINRRAAEAIACPRLVSPDVPGPFAFFCQPSSFSSACRQVGILPTTQTKQNTVTVTTNVTSTVRPVSVRTVSTSTTTTATVNGTVVTTSTTTLSNTRTTSVAVTETDVPGVDRFYINARGAAYNGSVSGTYTVQAGDPLLLTSNLRAYYYFRIGGRQNLLTNLNGVFVNGYGDYVVRFSGYLDSKDSRALRCDLSAATSGNLTCVSGVGQVTTLFQSCNNDGKLYHAPGLQSNCSTLQLYSVAQ